MRLAASILLALRALLLAIVLLGCATAEPKIVMRVVGVETYSGTEMGCFLFADADSDGDFLVRYGACVRRPAETSEPEPTDAQAGP